MEAYLCILIIIVIVVAYYSYRERKLAAERMSLMQIADKVAAIRAQQAAAVKERLAPRPAATAKPKPGAALAAAVVPWGNFM